MPKLVLGIDYGSKKIGLAVGQTVTKTAQPLKIIPANQFDKLFEPVYKQFRPDTIVLGLPLNMDDTEGEITKAVRKFGNKLAEVVDCPIEYVDERLTSKNAQWFIEERGLPKDTPLDAIAAALIVESFLASK